MAAFLRSFKWAGRGLLRCIMEERNFRFHLCAALYVYLLAWQYDFTNTQYCLLTILVGGVLAFELANSAIERTLNRVSEKKHPLIGAAKDMAAAAVLVYCIAAVVCGILLFWDTTKIIQIWQNLLAHPWYIAALLLSFAACLWFVFGFGRKGNHEHE